MQTLIATIISIVLIISRGQCNQELFYLNHTIKILTNYSYIRNRIVPEHIYTHAPLHQKNFFVL